MHAPVVLTVQNDKTVLVRLHPASEKHGPILHYYVVVVPLEITEWRQEDSFSLKEVRPTRHHSVKDFSDLFLYFSSLRAIFLTVFSLSTSSLHLIPCLFCEMPKCESALFYQISSLLQLQDSDGSAGNAAWIAAKFDGSSLPGELILGDNTRPGTGEHFNRPIPKRHMFKTFLRGYTSDTVTDFYSPVNF